MEEQRLACQRAAVFEDEALELSARSLETRDPLLIHRDSLSGEVRSLLSGELRWAVGAEHHVFAPAEKHHRRRAEGVLVCRNSDGSMPSLETKPCKACDAALRGE